MKTTFAVLFLAIALESNNKFTKAFAPSKAPAFGLIPRRNEKVNIAHDKITVNQNTFSTPLPYKTSLFMAFESTDEVELDVEERMGKTIESLKSNLVTIRTGRANPSILDLVKVDYYGVPTPINQMASISVPNSQQLSISPFDKSTLGNIERAIIESGLGLTPSNDGTIIRINIPPVTEERRKELLKQCKAMGEDGKVAIRNVRRDGVEAVKKMEKAGDIGEDESKGAQENIQKLTDKFVKNIDKIVSSKEKEVMTV